MTYVDAIHDRDQNLIHVVERIKGQRVYKEFPAEYRFYYSDPRGRYRTIYNTPVSRFSTHNFREFQREIRHMNQHQLWESDMKPLLRCLEERYLNQTSPSLHKVFFDIEVAFDPVRGFSKPEDPFNAVTAISMYMTWLDQLVSLVLIPPAMTEQRAQELTQDLDLCFLFRSEKQLFDTFFTLIEDADTLSGWNSEGFDIPYLVQRCKQVLSTDDTRRFCLWDQLPKQRKFERFGADHITFDLFGRVHMDYMQLYRKFTYEERHSYSLDSIGEYELNQRKIQYEGTLDQLYNRDFVKFIEYNRQDTMLLAHLDRKLKFLDLANQIAHENTVLLPTVMGAVAVTDQAIINEAHQKGLIVPDRRQSHDDHKAAGAYVATPKAGFHRYIGAIDINSLYPSTIRALNMAPETIVGQLRPTHTDEYINERLAQGMSFADAWEGLFGSLEYTAVMNQEPGRSITVDWESGDSVTMTAQHTHAMIFGQNRPWMLSANGTIFRSDTQGIIPGLLERWNTERKELQAKKKQAQDITDTEFWDKRQLVKKINLNSLYGAILNPGSRFFDKRIGQSTTLTGRVIARHMDAQINQCITGEYDHQGQAIIYGDTDSAIFTAYPTLKPDIDTGRVTWNHEICVQLYDSISESVNQSFPGFMEQAFNCPRTHGELIRGGRELVGSTGLFIKKKRYAILIYDKEGQRLDKNGSPGRVKAMGLDLKRSDTPKSVQDFLSDILLRVLTGAQAEEIYQQVREFKTWFKSRSAWEKGTPKRVNNLTHYVDQEIKQGRANMPGHVRAAMNWNTLRRINSDNRSLEIVDGMKTIVCKLRVNPLGLTSVGYPTDETHIPEWFKLLPFDDTAMEDTIVDQKVENLLAVMGWDITAHTDIRSVFDDLFSVE